MPEKPFRESDYVTDVLNKLSLSYYDLSKRLLVPQVRERSLTFERNMHRVILLAQLPEFVSRQTLHINLVQDIAIERIKVPEHIIQWSEEHRKYVNARIPTIALEVQESLNNAAPLVQKAHQERAKSALVYLFDPDSSHPVLDALQTLYISLLINTWTAFEAMAGDLWETALNVHPQLLADLKGRDSRIAKKAGHGEQESPEREEKVSNYEFALAIVHDITGGDYDLKHKMGTLLKRRFKFTSLKETRQAYSKAFSKKNEDIDVALSDNSLDMLNALRNVFAHKAGISDREYDNHRRKYSSLPQVEKDSQIVLEGRIIRERINAVISCGINLLIAVDNWLSTNSQTELG